MVYVLSERPAVPGRAGVRWEPAGRESGEHGEGIPHHGTGETRPHQETGWWGFDHCLVIKSLKKNYYGSLFFTF